MGTWGAAKAKAQFSAVLDRAESEGPQFVTRRKEEFVVLTRKQFADGVKTLTEPAKPFVSAWDALRPPFAERFDVEFPRAKGKTRRVSFE